MAKQENIDIRYDAEQINPFVALILAQRHKQATKTGGSRSTYYRYGNTVFTVNTYHDEGGVWTQIDKTEIQDLTRSDLETSFNTGFILP